MYHQEEHPEDNHTPEQLGARQPESANFLRNWNTTLFSVRQRWIWDIIVYSLKDLCCTCAWLTIIQIPWTLASMGNWKWSFVIIFILACAKQAPINSFNLMCNTVGLLCPAFLQRCHVTTESVGPHRSLPTAQLSTEKTDYHHWFWHH